MTDPIASARAALAGLLRSYIRDDTGRYVKFTLAAADRLALEAFDLVAAEWQPECPGCGQRHTTGHEDSCACDHCAWVRQTRASLEGSHAD
jgi:hypothetical protein